MLVWQLLSYKEYPETQNIYREIAQRDSGSVRYRALKILCEEYKDPIVLDISAQMLLTHNDWSSIVEAIWIFEDFGSPYALAKLTEVEKQMPAGVFITGLNPTFPQFETKKHITEEIKDYKPPIIEGSVLLALDSLKNYTYQCSQLQWIDNLSFVNSITNYLITAKTKLQAGDSVGCYQSVKQFQNGVNAEYRDTLNTTPNFVTIEGWKFLYYNSQYILERLPKPPPPSLVAALKNSNGAKLTDGTLQYYDASWKDAVNNNDGTFNITTTKTSLSLRMTYAYGSQQKNNVPVNSDTVIFQTINSQVQLKNSNGTLLDTGTVQYYAGAWRTFGTTTNGITTKELLPNNYSFRMTYAFASNDKSQDLNTNSIVLFQTVNASVQLKNSQGDLMDQGTVQYYSGAWRTFGTTTNGVAAKELLPNNYSFRMSYAFASKDTQQNLNTNPIVTFKTVNAQVQLKNSNGTFLDTGTVQYYAGAWRTFGTTTNGIIKKELLPNSYQFRLTYGFVSSDKTQNVGSDNIVNFSTVQTTVRVKNLQNNPVNNASVTYYSGAWRNFGTTANGEAVKELLPINLQFRAKLGTAQADKTQNLSTNRLVEIQLNVAQ